MILGEAAAAPNLRKQARRSVGGKVAMVAVPGIGKVWAEPPDTDDTFPMAIARYELKDGWLVYHGRDGSVGVIVGKLKELERWVKEVDRIVKMSPPPAKERPWKPSDGGKANLAKATRAAKRVLPTIKIEFFVKPHGDVEGDSLAGRARVVNAHLDNTTEVGGTKVHHGSKTAAHEAAHAVYAKDPAAGALATKALKAWGKGVSVYHGLAGDLEGTMEAAAWWALAPKHMERTAPELFDAFEAWLSGKSAVKEKPIDPIKAQQLASHAARAFDLFQGDPPAMRMESAAITTGRQAKRDGWTAEQLRSWLRSSYNDIWAMLGGGHPTLSLQALEKALLRGYKR